MAKSLKYIEYRQCSRKKGFYTTKDAIKAIRSNYQKSGTKQYYYRCPTCGRYHITKCKH